MPGPPGCGSVLLAQAIDTGKALAVDDVIETREVYESEHPVVFSREVAQVDLSLQVPRLTSVERYEVEVDAWSSSISNIVLLDSTLTFTANHQCFFDNSISQFSTWGYRFALVRFLHKRPYYCTVPPPSLELGWLSNSAVASSSPSAKASSAANYASNRCNWIRVTCEHDQVVKIDVSNQEHVGELSDLLGVLGYLTYLDLRYNSIGGSLPSLLHTVLPALETLLLSNNRLQGSVPAVVFPIANRSSSA